MSGRIKDLFIMVDEVTGDESSVAFLEGICKFDEEAMPHAKDHFTDQLNQHMVAYSTARSTIKLTIPLFSPEYLCD